jgi:hypothetical protein
MERPGSHHGRKPKIGSAGKSVQVEILEQAEQDLAEGHAFYDCQQVGLGDYFLDSMFAEIDSLMIYAGIHRVVFGSHRLLGRIFPYAVYYDVVGDKALVWAVVDCRRDPSWIMKRVKQGRTPRVV